MPAARNAASLEKSLTEIQKKFGVIGREKEISALLHCILAGKHVLLEGPVGVGKTFLVSAVASCLNRGVFRVDGDSRYTEQKLTGWFDPPSVLKKGYSKETYFDGPLSEAMRSGSILFINELNRMPEGVQNVLLPALDEQKIEVPRVGSLTAKTGFCVIATQNPREFVATSHLSEAILDRFELISLHYQNEAEEKEILKQSTSYKEKGLANEQLLGWCLSTVRNSRENPLFKRGASIRAGISLYDVAQSMGGDAAAFERACTICLPTRVELSEDGLELGIQKAIQQLANDSKKKSHKT